MARQVDWVQPQVTLPRSEQGRARHLQVEAPSFLNGSGAAIAGVVGGVGTAALTALAAQAAIAVANNPTDPGKALEQLGSSAMCTCWWPPC